MENNNNDSKTGRKRQMDEIQSRRDITQKTKILVIFFLVIVFGGGIALYKKKSDISSLNIVLQKDAEQTGKNEFDSLTSEPTSSFSQSMPNEDHLENFDSDEELEDITQELAEEAVAEKIQESDKRYALPNISFSVRGQRVEGEKLTFSINEYDPNITYTLQFGNGRQKQVGRRVVFAYEKAGTFRPTLIASNSSGDRKRMSRTVVISEKEPVKTEEIARQEFSSSTHSTPLDSSPSPAISGDIASLESNIPLGPEKEVVDINQPAIENEEKTVEKNQPAINTTPSSVEEAPLARPLKFAQVMPSFPGGTSAMYGFLNKKLNYPTLAYDNQIEGNVYVQFIVHPDGSLSQHRILKGIGYGCDEEVIRVVKQMPKWVPGKHNGKIVPVEYTLKVNFKFK